MKSSWFIFRGNEHRDTQREEHHGDNRGTDWNAAVISQAVPQMASHHQKSIETRENFSPKAFSASMALLTP